MDRVIGATCPYCQFPIKPGDKCVVCSQCKQPHHDNCWTENGRCTTFGCTGNPQPTGKNNPAKNDCIQCGQVNPEDALFCAQCGKRLPDDNTGPFLGDHSSYVQRQERGYTSQANTVPMPDRALSYPKASLLKRIGASIIDSLVGMPGIIAGIFLYGAGARGLGMIIWIAGFVWQCYYFFTKDGRAGGKSIGKSAFGLMVVHLPSNTPCTKRQSAMREATLSLGFVVSLLSGPVIAKSSGFDFLNVLNMLIAILESCLVLFTASGRRIGDRWAETQVIETIHYRP